MISENGQCFIASLLDMDIVSTAKLIFSILKYQRQRQQNGLYFKFT